MKTIIVMMLWTYSAISSEVFNSLSCSQKTRGTQIYFINGVLTSEFGKMSASNITQIIKNRVESRDFKKRIDQNEKVFIEYIYNNSEEFGLDFIQAAAQKIAETGEFPHARTIGRFLFKSGKACLSSPMICSGIIVSIGGLLAKQAYISNEDLRQMADLIQFHLSNNYKVIVISHSQGNLYANLIYTELLRRGVSTDSLNKYFGNLQIASVASSMKAKNNRLFSAREDMLVSNVRKEFPTTIKSNYSFINSPPSIDFLKHGMIESYLSDEVFAVGPKQGKGTTSRKASDVFLENLEEVAWMLANNDEDCCNGKDGRFYRKNYDSEPEKGFLEKTVQVEKGVKLEIDKDSQICGFVNIHSSSPNFKIKLINSTVNGWAPIDLKGNLFFKFTDVSSNYVPDKTLRIEGNTEQPLTFDNNSEVAGNLNISGSFIAENAKIYGTGNLKGSLFNRVAAGINTWYPPRIENATISGESDIKGFYTIKRDLHDTSVDGFAVNEESGSMKHTIIESHPWHINKGTISGPMYILGRVDFNVTLGAYGLPGGSYIDYSGIHLTSNSILWSSSRVRGAAYINNTAYGGNLDGNVLESHGFLHLSNNTISGTDISGAPYIIGSSIHNSTVTGNPVIVDSSFLDSSFSCNAYVYRESGSNKSFSCGYSTPPGKFQRKTNSVKFIGDYSDVLWEYENWFQNKKEEISSEFY